MARAATIHRAAYSRSPLSCESALAHGFDVADDGVSLVPNEAEQAVILDIRAMRSKGLTLERIAEALTERGVPTKTGKSTRWTHQAIARIIKRGR